MKTGENVTFKTVLAGPQGSILLFVLTLHTAQQFCGINAVFYYSTYFFAGVVDDPLVGR